MRSARSFKDLTRYPVVPWILKGGELWDYSD